jgi:deoxyadenosine/deoxycytidine kinase
VLDERRGIFLVTGAQAAGKSTVGSLLAERFDKGAFVEGDMMWKLIVSGREDMSQPPSDEAVRQLRLRYRNGAMLADSLFENGFTAVHSDIVMEHGLPEYVEMVRGRPLYVVMLRPSIAAVAARETGRGSSAYREWTTRGYSVEHAVTEFYEWIDNTPKLGLWIDSTDQTPDVTVDEIMARVWNEGAVG